MVVVPLERLLVIVTVALVALCAVEAAGAYPTSRPYYTDELTIGNKIESHGIWWAGRHKAIDNASCLGLRRFGVRPDTYGLDRFNRFKCYADGADNHAYSVSVKTVADSRPRHWDWVVTRVTREY
jgi:hypothetical protein